MAEVEQLLVCRDLRKNYGERTAVNGVSFHIDRGETYGLLGPNGAGKTTTISMICGLLERDGGEVTVAGQAVDVSAVEAKAAAISRHTAIRIRIMNGVPSGSQLP